MDKKKIIDSGFLGVLFCGGRGTRLGEITKYISKSFIPIFNKPVFKYGLELLEKSKFIDEIIILTNNENDEKLKQTGYKTIMQDDNVVFDMFSGWEYIKKITGTNKNGVLAPSDNISDVLIDDLIKIFLKENAEIVFSLFSVDNKEKLSQMGSYDIVEKKYSYRKNNVLSNLGIIAPYIVKNNINTSIGDSVFNNCKINYNLHKGYWFDIGDVNSIKKSSLYLMDKNK